MTAYPDRMFTPAQNVSSVQCYLWDISLLYAQRRDNTELAKQITHLQVHIQCTCCEDQLHPCILLRAFLHIFSAGFEGLLEVTDW